MAINFGTDVLGQGTMFSYTFQTSLLVQLPELYRNLESINEGLKSRGSL